VAKIVKLFYIDECFRFIFLCSISCSIFPLAGFSRTSTPVTLKGQVSDAKTAEPLPGASISLLNEKNGTVTDTEGNFIIQTKSLPVTISIRYIGYKTAEIEVGEYVEPISVQLHENTDLLDEVIVIGYGTQRRKDITGAIATLPKAALEQVSPTIDGLLGGVIAGLNVTQTSGQPGVGSSIRIRGGNSLYASNEPLYVIDGFIFYSEKSATAAGMTNIESNLNPLASINPADIESIEVLKDVSATAIYGSRGANGVILVTTKKGTRGTNTIHYQYTVGIDKSAKKIDLLTAKQWAAIQKEYFNDKVGLYYSPDEIARFGNGTDWQDAVLQTGFSQTHELSISGGDDKTRYLLSGNYTDQQGIILNSGFERFSGRINLDRELFHNLTAGITLTANKSTQNALTTFESSNYNDSPYSHGIANSLTYALYMPPVLPIYNADGSYNYTNPFEYSYLSYYGNAANPVSDLKNSIGQNIQTTLLGNFYVRYTIINGLVAKFNAGTNLSNITQNFFAPPYTALGINQDIQGTGGIGNRHTEVRQLEYTLNYSRQLHPEHFIDVLAGYTYQNTKTNFVLSQTIQLDSFDNLAHGESQLPPTSRTQGAYLYSALGRLNYTLLNRYNLTATFRADKSSRFAVGNDFRWGIFPSIGFSWNVSDEKFLQSSKPWLHYLKLRLSYGTVGNQEIGFDDFAQHFKAIKYDKKTALAMDNLGNNQLKWETTRQYNAGIDAGFLNERLTFVADVYYKKTFDLLMETPTALGSATSEKQMVNLGNVTNKGLEWTINVKPIENKTFTWSISANIARNINTITSLGKYDKITLGDDQEEILQTGESLGSFYGYLFEGVVQTGEDISKLPQVGGRTLQPGDAKLADLSGADGNPDGQVTPNDDRIVLGSIQPDFTYGFSTTLAWRRFDLYIALQGSQGNEVYNLLHRFLERPNDSYNLSSALLNAWTENNPSNTIPHLNSTRSAELDSRYVEDASFLKLKNITLSYTLPLKLNALPVKFRIFASGQNLYTLTKYKGYDPEVANGTDLGVYPSARTFLAGIGVTF
jgi:TonB-linked SusC/RagA family outer membrane protein